MLNIVPSKKFGKLEIVHWPFYRGFYSWIDPNRYSYVMIGKFEIKYHHYEGLFNHNEIMLWLENWKLNYLVQASIFVIFLVILRKIILYLM